jgi:hypothetical protein
MGCGAESLVMPRLHVRPATLIAFAAASLLVRPDVALAHPLHTSLAEIAYDAKTESILVSLRVFVDDFTKASNAYKQRIVLSKARHLSWSPLVNYAVETFTIADDAGRRLSLQPCGGKRVGDLMWLCFRARVGSPPRSIKVSSTILFDMYKDQINVVQATFGVRKSNALFTPGDGPKQLR